MATILGCVMSLSLNEICINRVTSFWLFILTWFAFLLILLLEIFFKSVQFVMKLGILLAFQNLQEVKYSKWWPPMAHNRSKEEGKDQELIQSSTTPNRILIF